MSASSTPATVSASKASPVGDVLRGLLLGLLPLLLLAILVTATLALTVFIRQQLAASSFFAQQQVDLITLIAGLVVALLVYIVALVLVVWRVKVWQQVGAGLRANVALWMLALSALIVLLPMILAVLLPQHAAP